MCNKYVFCILFFNFYLFFYILRLRYSDLILAIVSSKYWILEGISSLKQGRKVKYICIASRLSSCRKELVVFCHIRHRETNNTIFSRRIIQMWTINDKQWEINEYLRTHSLFSQLKECNLRENSSFETDTTVNIIECARGLKSQRRDRRNGCSYRENKWNRVLLELLW